MRETRVTGAAYWRTTRLPRYSLLFALPALRLIAGWITPLLAFVLLASVLVHLVDGAIQPLARFKGFAPHVKAHLSVLMGMIVASKAFELSLANVMSVGGG